MSPCSEWARACAATQWRHTARRQPPPPLSMSCAAVGTLWNIITFAVFYTMCCHIETKKSYAIYKHMTGWHTCTDKSNRLTQEKICGIVEYVCCLSKSVSRLLHAKCYQQRFWLDNLVGTCTMMWCVNARQLFFFLQVIHLFVMNISQKWLSVMVTSQLTRLHGVMCNTSLRLRHPLT